MQNLFNLSNKVAVITGAANGLGYELSKLYASYGADIVMLDIEFNKLDNLVKEVKSFGVEALAVQCDVTKEEDIKNVVSKVLNTFNKVDILVNNAGISSNGTVEDIEEAEWKKVMDTNVKSIYLMIKYLIKDMKLREYGKIINIASVCGLISNPSIPLHAYNTSKAAVINLTKSLAVSYAKDGITVNAIAPSLFKTKMTKNLIKNDDFIQMYQKLCPMGRSGNLQELHGGALYFASDASSYTTGQTLFIDGGISCV